MSVQLYHGDCLEVMPTLDAQSFDAIIADLPYGTTACKWDVVIPFEPLWREYKRLIKPRGAIVLFGSQPFTSLLVMSNLEWFKYEWVWDKGVSGSFANAKYAPLRTNEDVCVFSKNGHTYNPQMTKRDKPAKIGGVRSGSTQGGRPIVFNPNLLSDNKVYHEAYPKTVVYLSPRSDTSRGLHPTQKPVALLEYLIRTYTNEGDTVLDNVMGSGTTGVACQQTGRNFVGIEKDAGYFEIAKRRIETAQLPLLEAA